MTRKVLTRECGRSSLYSSILLIRQVVKKRSVTEKRRLTTYVPSSQGTEAVEAPSDSYRSVSAGITRTTIKSTIIDIRNMQIDGIHVQAHTCIDTHTRATSTVVKLD